MDHQRSPALLELSAHTDLSTTFQAGWASRRFLIERPPPLTKCYSSTMLERMVTTHSFFKDRVQDQIRIDSDRLNSMK